MLQRVTVFAAMRGKYAQTGSVPIALVLAVLKGSISPLVMEPVVLGIFLVVQQQSLALFVIHNPLDVVLPVAIATNIV
jgi:hypothetical protein